MDKKPKSFINNTKTTFEDKLVKIALVGSLLPSITSLIFIVTSDLSIYLRILLIFVIAVVVIYTAFLIRQQVIFQLRTSTNLVEAMTSGDYTLRANNKDIRGALSDFNMLLNSLADRLATQSLITREKQILLSKVTDQIDVAIVACDELNNITLMNPAAERLFKKSVENVQGSPLKTLGLQSVIGQSINKITEFEISQTKRKVYVRTDTYFELGNKHQLIFITDIQNLLREEERQAWQKLLRVLSHEINNSLTPIASISETLSHIVANQDSEQAFAAQDKQNMSEGLAVITERAHSLNHFIQDYQQLTRLPLPNKKTFDLLALFQSITLLFEQANFSFPKDNIQVYGDSEQLQQVFVNLIKNAHEANVSYQKKQNRKASNISINWVTNDNFVVITVIDEGAGIKNEDNLFVPFYTTKKQGSGIGLTLSRQIALNHGGDLRLSNNVQKGTEQIEGAIAELSLPLA